MIGCDRRKIMKKRRTVSIGAARPAVEHHPLATGRGDQQGAMPVIIEHYLARAQRVGRRLGRRPGFLVVNTEKLIIGRGV